MAPIRGQSGGMLRGLRTGSRRVASFTLALLGLVWINMALQPCLMAAEPLLPDQHHESGCPHCPPAPERHCGNDNAGRCAFIESIDFDGRHAVTTDLPDPQSASPLASGCETLPVVGLERFAAAKVAPPPDTGPPIFLRDCRFLK